MVESDRKTEQGRRSHRPAMPAWGTRAGEKWCHTASRRRHSSMIISMTSSLGQFVLGCRLDCVCVGAQKKMYIQPALIGYEDTTTVTVADDLESQSTTSAVAQEIGRGMKRSISRKRNTSVSVVVVMRYLVACSYMLTRRQT